MSNEGVINKADGEQKTSSHRTEGKNSNDDDFMDKFNQEMSSRMEDIAGNLRQSFESQLDNLQSKLAERSQGDMGVRQTTVLKVNKIFREVGQELDSDWEKVFEYLMQPFGQKVYDEAVFRLRRTSEVTRPYKALIEWKEAAGKDHFHIVNLSNALKSCRPELAVLVDNILNCDDNEDLFKLTRSISKKKTMEGRREPSKQLTNQIDNRIVLKLSKLIAADWRKVGECLGLDNELLDDLSITSSSQPEPHQKAFQMLTDWRLENGEKATKDKLVTCLKKGNFSKLAKELDGIKSSTKIGPDGEKIKKLTKAEKEEIKLRSEADKLRRSGEEYRNLLSRLEKWIEKEKESIFQCLRNIDTEECGMVSSQEFKSAMFDLNCPANKVETHLFAMLLDEDCSGNLKYNQLENGLSFCRNLEEFFPEDVVRPSLVLSKKKSTRWDGDWLKRDYVRYARVHFKHATFSEKRDHHTHFIQLVHSHATVSYLLQLVKERIALESNRLALFTDDSLTIEAQLPPASTLEECGISGGSYDKPQDVLLYYDYVVEFTGCPILNSDHYFA
ncbi:DgyrCDS6243 [Dimorphilus gyrociliatus]|uniref:DgyrCDS6243 n=1 Tax=Dimorphilus gyrociliatus TaxID=2664684 RepID=A0A7I8VMN5_9ANNE|nr:DgyrCDS6243 [Dimorphilus gyrociliatus]